jgi:uncharacterized repeat protein (TIGR03847 family)
MDDYRFDLDPVNRITVGAVGSPGKRVFYLQARRGRTVVTLLLEKEQARALATAVDRLLEELAERAPQLSFGISEVSEAQMRLEEPISPEFRIGQMSLGYDADRDLIVLVVQEMPQQEEQSNQPETTLALARFWATRQQMRALSQHTGRVVAAGRPICGNCGEPMDPSGHFCPRRNGHPPPEF